MANGKTHRTIGTVAGVGAALYRARDLGSWPLLAEGLGGAAGGRVGGVLPDILEPATTPRHRGPMHSWLTASGLVTVVNRAVTEAQSRSRERALQWEASFADATGLEALIAGVAALFWRFVSGFVAGLQGGYVSHLGLDCVTPAGLPILI